MKPTRRFNQSTLIGAICFIAGVTAAFAASPAYRYVLAQVHQEQYGDLVFKCDQAMREHFVAKARVDTEPTEESATILAQAEVGLMDCHDYDLMRKQLLRLGLTEDDLSAMGLEVIEARGKDIRELVRIHEIRY